MTSCRKSKTSFQRRTIPRSHKRYFSFRGDKIFQIVSKDVATPASFWLFSFFYNSNFTSWTHNHRGSFTLAAYYAAVDSCISVEIENFLSLRRCRLPRLVWMSRCRPCQNNSVKNHGFKHCKKDWNKRGHLNEKIRLSQLPQLQDLGLEICRVSVYQLQMWGLVLLRLWQPLRHWSLSHDKKMDCIDWATQTNVLSNIKMS